MILVRRTAAIALAMVALTSSLLSNDIALAGATVTHICKQYWHLPVDAGRYIYRNDDWANRGECLTNDDGTANFAVLKSGANGYQGKPAQVQAYPYIFTGWSWGIGTVGTLLPARVRRIHPVVTMDTADNHASGRWNAAIDMWFSSHPLHNGQAKGAELMIWPNARGNARWSPRRIVHVDGVKWYFKDWTTRHTNGDHWPLIIFWRVHPETHINGLAMRPFIHQAGELIKHRWYLLNIEAGFEIWEGGQGLSVTNFRVGIHKSPYHKPHKRHHKKHHKKKHHK